MNRRLVTRLLLAVAFIALFTGPFLVCFAACVFAVAISEDEW